MKKTLIGLMLLLSVSGALFAQNLIQNGNFQSIGSCNACSTAVIGCYGSSGWYNSQGSASVLYEGNNPCTNPGGNTNYYVELVSIYNSPSNNNLITTMTGIYYSGLTFNLNATYTISFSIRSLGNGGDYNISLANGLSPGNSLTLPTVANQPIVSTSISNTDWQTVSYTFTANNTYNQLWIYNANQVYSVVDIDNISVTSICCAPNITYTNNTSANPLPALTTKLNYIDANTNVLVLSGSNVTFLAGDYIELDAGFETQSSSNFLAYISPCPTAKPTTNAGGAVQNCFVSSVNCLPIGSLPVSGEIYNWTSSPSNYISNLSSISSSDPNVCGPLPVVTITYTLAATNACGTTTSQMVATSDPGCRVGVFDDPSIDQIDQTGLSYFPNPSNGKFYVTLPNRGQNAKLTIKDISGKAIYIKTLSETQSEIELTNIPAGVYILAVEIDNETTNNRIIIQ
jgi:hypothetical protein